MVEVATGGYMAFEVFTRQVTRTTGPSITVTPYGRINLNKTVVTMLDKQGIENVLLLWDKSVRKMGIRPVAKKDPRAYQVNLTNKRTGVGFSAKTFLDYINLSYEKSRSFAAEWNDEQNMLEVQFPADAFAPDAQTSLLPMEYTAAPARKLRSVKN